jgi:hypothetical protein
METDNLLALLFSAEFGGDFYMVWMDRLWGMASGWRYLHVVKQVSMKIER